MTNEPKTMHLKAYADAISTPWQTILGKIVDLKKNANSKSILLKQLAVRLSGAGKLNNERESRIFTKLEKCRNSFPVYVRAEYRTRQHRTGYIAGLLLVKTDLIDQIAAYSQNQFSVSLERKLHCESFGEVVLLSPEKIVSIEQLLLDEAYFSLLRRYFQKDEGTPTAREAKIISAVVEMLEGALKKSPIWKPEGPCRSKIAKDLIKYWTEYDSLKGLRPPNKIKVITNALGKFPSRWDHPYPNCPFGQKK